jgi:predicted flap endonuclease-1-like 5' DNA nuclease
VAMSFTINQWALIALVFVLGWLLGLLSRTGGRWREAYEEERAAHAKLRADYETRIAAANQRIAELERHQPAIHAGTAGAVAAAASGRRDDLTRIQGIDTAEELRLNDAGIHGFRDITAMSADQEAAIEARLGYARGRIAAERWREQADALARGRPWTAPADYVPPPVDRRV